MLLLFPVLHIQKFCLHLSYRFSLNDIEEGGKRQYNRFFLAFFKISFNEISSA